MATKKVITTYRLRVPVELWDRYKSTVSKSRTMNDALVELVQTEVTRNEKKV